MTPRNKTILQVSLAAAATILVVLAYLPALSAGWNFDDFGHILNNPSIQNARFSLGSLTQVVRQSPLKNRALANLSLAVDFLSAGGFKPRAFHATNLALHLLAAFLAWLFLMGLFSQPRIKLPWPRAAAGFGALIFGLSPVQAQSVAYVVQRMNIMAGLFTLAALVLWLRLQRRPQDQPLIRLVLWKGFFLSALAGLLSKENAIALVPLIAVLDRCLFPGDFRDWFKARRVLLLAVIAVGVMLSLVYAHFGGSMFMGYKFRNFTMLERVMTQPRVIFWYVSLWLWPAPFRLSLDHAVITSTGLLHPPVTILAVIVLIGLTALALLRAEKAPLLALGWLWFISGLVLESSILPLEMAFEHRLYLPGLGLFMIAADLAARLKLDKRAAPVLALVVLLFSLATYSRARVWQDPIQVWRDSAKKAPTKVRPWSNLCAVTFVADRLPESERFCRVALKLDPKDAASWYNLGLSLYRQHQFPEAESALSTSAQLDPQPETLYQLARARMVLSRLPEAETTLLQAIHRDPSDPVYWYQLALIQLAQNKKEEGKQALLEARKRAKPGDEVIPEIENALKLLEKQGN